MKVCRVRYTYIICDITYNLTYIVCDITYNLMSQLVCICEIFVKIKRIYFNVLRILYIHTYIKDKIYV